MMDSEIFFNYLTNLFGPNAKFKEDQLEAIQSTINNHFTLVVEKTGWGKSLVYFFATKYFREKGYGPSIIISPLLSLMRNQIENASKLNLKTRMLTYETNKNGETDDIFLELKDNLIDILFITPEQLAKQENQTRLYQNITTELKLFVIDEVHCVSEWGHDFRPDFLEIKNFVNSDLIRNKNIHILTTTATADNYVIKDLQDQFKTDIRLIRGPLTRESLNIKIIKDLDIIQRYAWILNYLNHIEGSGIIYCLTIRECNSLSSFLVTNGISAHPYHADIDNQSPGKRQQLETDFLNNKIKVLVATSALGMGYDKPDVAFVIHLQCPKSMLEYYQQIGRAGRNLNNADAILMYGPSDERISEYFIKTAFPSPELMRTVLSLVDQYTEIKLKEILARLNIKQGKLEAILKHLCSRKLVIKNGAKYSRTLTPDNLDEYITSKNEITKIRREEMLRMREYIDTQDCLMEYISHKLNDPHPQKCGKCMNCTGIYPSIHIPEELLRKSDEFHNSPYKISTSLCEIKPRRQFPYTFDGHFNIPENLQNKPGFFLTRYDYDSPLCTLIRNGKYKDKHFSDELVNKMVGMISFLLNSNKIISPDIITYIPSLKRTELVKSFAHRVADKLGIPCIDAIVKTKQNEEQKSMENSAMQFENVNTVFDIKKEYSAQILSKNVVLIDDMVDSGWTLTTVGYKLLKYTSANSVTPFVLADTSTNYE